MSAVVMAYPPFGEDVLEPARQRSCRARHEARGSEPASNGSPSNPRLACAERYGERRTRTADTSIFSGEASILSRPAEASEKARVCWHFGLSLVVAEARAIRRDTGGYPWIPGGLGLRAVSVGPNPNRGQARQDGYAACLRRAGRRL